MQGGATTVAEAGKVEGADAAGGQALQGRIHSCSGSAQLPLLKGESLSRRKCPRSPSMESISPGGWTEVSSNLPDVYPCIDIG